MAHIPNTPWMHVISLLEKEKRKEKKIKKQIFTEDGKTVSKIKCFARLIGLWETSLMPMPKICSRVCWFVVLAGGVGMEGVGWDEVSVTHKYPLKPLG